MNLPNNLILHQYEIGPLNNFLYIYGCQETKDVAIIDPAWDVPFLISECEKNGYTIKKVFLTHGHPDHVNGLDELLEKFDVPVYISKHEANVLTPDVQNLNLVEDGDELSIGHITFKCLYAPGHSPGCHMFLYKNTLITGDVIFIDGCGRCDFPYSDPEQMYHSLYDVVAKLPDETILFTGHNYGPTPTSTVGEQKKSNVFLTCDSKEMFLRYRMGIRKIPTK